MLNKITKYIALVIFASSTLLLNTNTKAESGNIIATNETAFETKFLAPANNLTTSDHNVDVKLSLKLLNDYFQFTGETFELRLFVVNNLTSFDFYNNLTTNKDDYARRTVKFTSLNEVQTFNFENIPLPYKGNNYIFWGMWRKLDQNSTLYLYEDEDVLKVNYTGNITPLYRFYSSNRFGHFYTANIAERDQVIANYPDEPYCIPMPAEGCPYEMENVTAWKYEGLAYNVASADKNDKCLVSNTSPVYRFWNPTAMHHFYTANGQEKEVLVNTNPNWQFEGVEFCARNSSSSNTKPIFRFYNSSKLTHFYTANAAEKDELIKTNKEWNYEGIAYYAFN